MRTYPRAEDLTSARGNNEISKKLFPRVPTWSALGKNVEAKEALDKTFQKFSELPVPISPFEIAVIAIEQAKQRGLVGRYNRK